MIAIVCGGRNFEDVEFIRNTLDELQPDCIIQKGCRGVDSITKEWAEHSGIPCFTCPANWDYHGKKAGPLRNKWMLDFTKATHLIAFPGGVGTRGMIELAKKANLEIVEVEE